MTGQISDKVIYNGDNYVLVGERASGLFCPSNYGLRPEMISTACYRGYYCTYELKDDAIYLRELVAYDPTNQYPLVNGVAAKPIVDTVHCFIENRERGELKEITRPERRYSDVNLAIDCTGRLRIAKDFIEDLYIHMGFQKASAFERVLDITFFKGKIASIHDRSAEMEKKRGHFKDTYESGDIMETIRDAFKLDLDLE